MRRVKGIARAVVSIAGAISLSSPLLAAAPSGVVQKAPSRYKDRAGIVNEEQVRLFSAPVDSVFRDKAGEATDIKPTWR
jgi:hypothetical protein